MRYYYATISLDEFGNQICSGIINTYAEMDIGNVVLIESEDMALIGKMWNGESWVENPNPPIPVVESDPVAELSAVIDVMLGTETEGATVEQMEETVDEMLGGGTV